MEPLALVFGRRVRALRLAKRWTQEQLAEAAGLGAKHVGVIERGEKPSSFESVEKLARAFGTECFRLFVPDDGTIREIDKEIDIMLRDESRIEIKNLRAFLHDLRTALRKLDVESPTK